MKTPDVAPGDGFAADDAVTVGAWRSVLVKAVGNDGDGASVTAVDILMRMAERVLVPWKGKA